MNGIPEGHSGEPQYAIANGWLVEIVNGCTCGTGGTSYGHEPGCGAEPVARIERLLTAEARIAAVEAKAGRLRGYAEQYLYDGDSDQPLPGYVEVYGAADELSALAASPTPTAAEKYAPCRDCGHDSADHRNDEPRPCKKRCRCVSFESPLPGQEKS